MTYLNRKSGRNAGIVENSRKVMVLMKTKKRKKEITEDHRTECTYCTEIHDVDAASGVVAGNSFQSLLLV